MRRWSRQSSTVVPQLFLFSSLIRHVYKHDEDTFARIICQCFFSVHIPSGEKHLVILKEGPGKMMKIVSLSKVTDVTDEAISFAIYENVSRYTHMESHDCLKVSMCKLVDATARIFDRIHILLDQIYKSLGGGVIVLGADNKLLYALVIVFDWHSTLFNLLHTAVGVGAIILDAADTLLCVQVIIFGLNNIVLDAFAIPISAVNIIVGSKTILRSTCASW